MSFSRLQKFLASILLLFFFFNISISIPLLNRNVFAGEDEFYDLVSIIIDDKSFVEIKDELYRYSQDISSVLENTKVIILPVPRNTESFNIASMNETLYFEGYKGFNKDVYFNSKLIGTIFVGDINLPIVFDKGNSKRTVLPYTDFINKSYVYDKNLGKYKSNLSDNTEIKPEIWHSFISPNTGNFRENIKSLKVFFNKNHDYYNGLGIYKQDSSVINGKIDDKLPLSYEPYVFYFDSFRESKGFNSNLYNMYLSYQKNKEDIVFNKYTKKLAKNLKQNSVGGNKEEIIDLIKKLNPNLDTKLLTKQDNSLDKITDIQSKYIINNSTKTFLESYSKGIIGDFRKDVHNAGRYNYNNGVNIDFIPYLISAIDFVNDEIMKEMNDDLENKSDDVITKSNLIEDLIIPEKYVLTVGNTESLYENYIYGRKVSNMNNAMDCNIILGTNKDSGQAVEANRGYNVYNSSKDLDKLKSLGNKCLKGINSGESLKGLWGKNSPLYLNKNGNNFKGKTNYNGAIVPIFDVKGSKYISSLDSKNKFLSPETCLDYNLILSKKTSNGKIKFSLPEYGGKGWDCYTDNASPDKTIFLPPYDILKDTIGNSEKCVRKKLYIDGILTLESTGIGYKNYHIQKLKNGIYRDCDKIEERKYYYKKISSFIELKSPTKEEIKNLSNSKLTQSIGIVQDRHSSFKNKKTQKYVNYNYPNLFRLKVKGKKEASISSISKGLDKYLSKKSQEIFKLTGKKFDYKLYLQNHKTKNVAFKGFFKDLNYYDLLVFSIYWNNADISSKYSFVFENYLSEDFKDNGYFLPKLKKSYEIAYLGAKGRSDAMYIGFDPDIKKQNPYKDILSKNKKLASNIFSSNISYNYSGDNFSDENKIYNSGIFDCAPADGVPLHEWIPAVKCWISNMLPPKLDTKSNGCSSKALLDYFDGDEKSYKKGFDFLDTGSLDSTNNSGKKTSFSDSSFYRKDTKNCQISLNKSGVCLDDVSKIELYSTSSSYNINSNIKLKAQLKGKDNSDIKNINFVDIDFYITKVEKKKDKSKEFSGINTEVIFDIKNQNKNDKKLYEKYINFNPISIRSSFGSSIYSFSVNNEEINVYVKSKVNLGEKTTIFSPEKKLKIRKNSFFASLSKITSDSNNSKDIFKVSGSENLFLLPTYKNDKDGIIKKIKTNYKAEEKAIISLSNFNSEGKEISLNYPLEAKLYLGNSLIQELKISTNSDFSSFVPISKLGDYTIKVKDAKGFSTTENIKFISDKPSKIDLKLGSNILASGNGETTSIITLFDKFGNISKGEMYKVEISIDGDSVVFSDKKKTLTKNILEGYSIFKLKSSLKTGNNKINISLFDESDKKILITQKSIKVIDDLQVEIEGKEFQNFKVGNNKYNFKLRFKDNNGNYLKDFNSRVYFGAGNNYLKTTKDYFDIINGEANIEFQTKTLAGKDIAIEIKIEGINSIKYETLTIKPDIAIKLDLINSSPKLQASFDSFSVITAKLKDRYDNLVFTDSETKLNIEINGDSSNIIKFQKSQEKEQLNEVNLIENDFYNENEVLKPISKGIKFKNGEASFNLYATKTPGLGYFMVETFPSLSKNKFQIKDKSKTLDIFGIGENSSQIETFYFWDKNSIKKSHYNSLYTTLLGANYGDITKKDYLAGALIFDKNSRALAVTSIIDTPYKKDNSFSISDSGNIKNLVSSLDISQDIDYNLIFDKDNFSLNLYNKSLKQNIGKLYYKLPQNLDLSICREKCDISNKKTSLFGKTLDSYYYFSIFGDKLYFNDSKGKKYFSIDKFGNIDRKSSIKLEIDTENTKDFLKINITYAGKVLGFLGISFKNAVFKVNSNSFSNLENNSITLFLENNFYNYDIIGDKDKKTISVYYNDPFKTENNSDNFSSSNLYGYESFINKKGLGWNDGNKALLSFAAGENVGDSVKKSASFSVINLGDPVISLKKIRKGFNKSKYYKKFDSTIGEIIFKNEDVESYEIFDYNGDSRDDILLISTDKYLKLLENKNVSSNFIDMGNLAYLADLGNPSLLKTGDFTGDSFDDIVFVSDKGKIYILNNENKDFKRIDLTGKFNLNGRVMRMEIFDMDADSKDDIITLDDNGEINIFYGGSLNGKLNFTKKMLSDKFALNLSSKPRANNSLVYFDSLYQISENRNQNDKLNSILKSKKLISSLNGNNSGKDITNIDKSLVESMVFERLPYISNNLKENNSNSQNLQNTKTFIKGEYASSAGLKIEKVFKDLNGGNFKSSDEVEVTINITNITDKKITNIIYLEKLENFLKLKNKNIKSNKKNIEIKTPIGSYDFMIDGISLNAGEKLILKYKTITSPIKYNYIKVGLFETGETGDDIYGDIIVQDSYKNCGGNMDLFRSVSSRSYKQGIKEIKCEEKSDNKNTIDNLLPNNINAILNGSKEDQQKYAEEQLKNLEKDSDGDGKSDDEDMFNMSNGKLIFDLSHLTDNLENGLDNLENIINGFSCGFNNGGCISSPLNWAPLAPGNDPVFMGKPIGDGFRIDEGIPVFSAMTECSFVRTWPPCPNGAGGYLGIDNPSNRFRFFVSPTLTGGIGTAICFGGPARVWGQTPPPTISPLVPGGNCIVMAKPIFGCSDDGSDGDVNSIGIIEQVGGVLSPDGKIRNGEFGYINGNCSDLSDSEKSIDKSYLNSLVGQNKSKSLWDKIVANDFKGALSDHSTYDGRPLIEIGANSGKEVSITVDDLKNTDFSDITKMTQKRISAFPSFLMDWVTRQIQEIKSKLTDLPTITIILPDFSGVFDRKLSWQENRDNWFKRSGNSSRLEGDSFSLDSSFSSYNSTSSIEGYSKKINSGIKEAYELLASIPLVKVEQELIYINLPWFGKQDLERVKASWKATVISRKEEWQDFKSLLVGKGVSSNIIDELDSEVNNLIRDVETNIEIVEDYLNISEKIFKLLEKKEEYLEQILCNINSLLDMFGGRIGENGERFRAWVETYILIKSILKSWQIILDIFNGYEAECSQCKNERRDTLDWEFKLISMIVPDIPVVKFPKWPDINIDLHNIRAGVNVKLPQFEINAVPIVIPDLPKFYLPKDLDINLDLKLPKIPILPTFEIPELPDIPSLPTVELPNLPPPPKLPKLFAGFEFITDIAKLVTKAMCILKMSPFVPEWRAGDQIAFLTERNGYLPFDFLSLTLPQYSFPFVDSIDITTYLNLEYDTDFIIEMSRSLANPINNFTPDFSNKLNVTSPSIDLRKYVPSKIDIDVDLESKEKSVEIRGSTKTNLNNSPYKNLTYLINNKIIGGYNYFEKNKFVNLSNDEIKKEILSNLSSDILASEPRFDEIRKIWKEVNNYNFSKEDKLIKDLQKNNKEKFDALKDIINTEIISTKKQKSEFKKILKTGKIKVSSSEIQDYNEYLKVYNNKSFESISNIFNKSKGENNMEDEIKNYNNLRKIRHLAINNTNNNFRKSSSINKKTSNCYSPGKANSYVYEGIYIVENSKSYRLTDYIDELSGDEKIKTSDFDLDGDEDMFYFANNILYLKENLSNFKEKNYLKEKAYLVKMKDNKFLDNSKFIESINGLKETVSSSFVNISFSSLSDIYNYRFSYYNIIDKYLSSDKFEESYLKRKNIVDGISGIDKVNLLKEDKNFYLRKNIATLKNVGNFKGTDIYTQELKGIKQDILDGNIIFISTSTRIYTGKKDFKFKYLEKGSNEIKEYNLEANNNIQFKSAIKIIEIISGEGYIKTGFKKHYIGKEILALEGFPIFSETFIKNDSSKLSKNSYVELVYYDDSFLGIDFNDVYSYELYNLGDTGKDYLFSLDREPDFYYGNIVGFDKSIYSTVSNNVLSSPSLNSSKNKPKLYIKNIKIPVYQRQKIDITDEVFSDGGKDFIKDINVDFYLDKDTNEDGILTNDDDTKTMKSLDAYVKNSRLILEIGKFDKIMSKKIGISVLDKNGNIGYKELDFEVYSPDLKITDFKNNIISGKLSEKLTMEPINIYRYRGGDLEKIYTNDNKSKVFTSKLGNYNFRVDDYSKNLTLSYSGTKIAKIDELTGKINLLPLHSNNYSIKAKIGDDLFPKIFIKDKNGKSIFYENLKLKTVDKVQIINLTSQIKDSSIYVELLDKLNYNFYSLATDIPYNPGSLVLYKPNDKDKKSLINIFRDGRIKLAYGYKISYNYFDDYISIDITDDKSKKIASIIYYVKGDYILN